MSSKASKPSEPAAAPDWLWSLLAVPRVEEGGTAEIRGRPFVMRDGILRSKRLHSESQAQTSDAFGFKWHQRESFESDVSLIRTRDWLVEKYGDVAAAPWWSEYGEAPLLLDAGCGASMGALALFEPILGEVRYLGADVSAAVEVAAQRFAAKGLPGSFLQADLGDLPLAEGSVDVILSEGVLHHTDSTEGAIGALAPLLREGGRILFYVYRQKGPIREFTDDYVRDRMQELPPDQAWEAMYPLTKLGQALGELDVEVEVPEDISLLGIPAGAIDIQRLFYWHVFKAYYDPELSLEEMNHINFDWYAPRNAHRQTPEEVRAWCEQARLEIEHEHVQEAGITVIARKAAPSAQPYR